MSLCLEDRPVAKAEADGAGSVEACHVTPIHGALRLVTRVPPLPWPVPLSRFEKCAPRSGTSSCLLSGRGPTVKEILTVRHILCDRETSSASGRIIDEYSYWLGRELSHQMIQDGHIRARGLTWKPYGA
jgi:hypothetical protein